MTCSQHTDISIWKWCLFLFKLKSLKRSLHWCSLHFNRLQFPSLRHWFWQPLHFRATVKFEAVVPRVIWLPQEDRNLSRGMSFQCRNGAMCLILSRLTRKGAVEQKTGSPFHRINRRLNNCVNVECHSSTKAWLGFLVSSWIVCSLKKLPLFY